MTKTETTTWRILFYCAVGINACFAWGLDFVNTPRYVLYIVLMFSFGMGALIEDLIEDVKNG